MLKPSFKTYVAQLANASDTQSVERGLKPHPDYYNRS